MYVKKMQFQQILAFSFKKLGPKPLIIEEKNISTKMCYLYLVTPVLYGNMICHIFSALLI